MIEYSFECADCVFCDLQETSFKEAVVKINKVVVEINKVEVILKIFSARATTDKTPNQDKTGGDKEKRIERFVLVIYSKNFHQLIAETVFWKSDKLIADEKSQFFVTNVLYETSISVTVW